VYHRAIVVSFCMEKENTVLKSLHIQPNQVYFLRISLLTAHKIHSSLSLPSSPSI
jgi:hypothetical protein